MRKRRQGIQDTHSGCLDNGCDGHGAIAIALGADEHFSYVSSVTKDAVAVLDLKRNQFAASIRVGRLPRAIQVAADGRRAYVVNVVNNSVSAMDLSPDHAMIAVAEEDAGHVRLLKFSTLKTVGVYPVSGKASALRFSADGKQCYVMHRDNSGDEALSILDLKNSVAIGPYIEQYGNFLCEHQE
ncbi:DNA-binding beta-propeller fold protein YncE [Oxalobacteraceae bacterium GrIS 1.11]